MIRESIDLSAYKKRKIVVDKFFEENINLNESLDINEGSIDSIKKSVIKLLQGIFDMDILNDILVRLYKKDFDITINGILEEKDMMNVAIEFKEMFFGLSGTLEDKKEFLEGLKNGLISESVLVGTKTSTKITSILNVFNPFIKKITPRIMRWIPKQMDASAVGAGEVLLILYVKGGSKAKVGDVNINGSHLEVKGVKNKSGSAGARLKNRSAYNTFQAYYKEFYNDISLANTTMMLPNDANAYNFSSSKIKNLNTYLPDTQVATITLISKYFAKVYDLKPSKFSWLKKVVDKNGNLSNDFLKEYAYQQYLMYKSLENFKTIVWFNEANQTIMYSKDDKSVRKDIYSGIIVVSGSVSWKDANSVTFQFGIA